MLLNRRIDKNRREMFGLRERERLDKEGRRDRRYRGIEGSGLL